MPALTKTYLRIGKHIFQEGEDFVGNYVVEDIDVQDEDSPSQNENSRQRLREMIAYLVSQMDQGKRLGADFSEVESLLLGATMMIDTGSYEDATELINQCSQMAGQRLLDYEQLTQTIRKAEIEIRKAENGGKDITEAKQLLDLARHHKGEGNYKMGVSHAKKALGIFDGKKEVEISWGSGL